jgi:hypothetical protein
MPVVKSMTGREINNVLPTTIAVADYIDDKLKDYTPGTTITQIGLEK